MMGSELNSGESDLERPEGGVAESTVTEGGYDKIFFLGELSL